MVYSALTHPNFTPISPKNRGNDHNCDVRHLNTLTYAETSFILTTMSTNYYVMRTALLPLLDTVRNTDNRDFVDFHTVHLCRTTANAVQFQAVARSRTDLEDSFGRYIDPISVSNYAIDYRNVLDWPQAQQHWDTPLTHIDSIALWHSVLDTPTLCIIDEYDTHIETDAFWDMIDERIAMQDKSQHTPERAHWTDSVDPTTNVLFVAQHFS